MHSRVSSVADPLLLCFFLLLNEEHVGWKSSCEKRGKSVPVLLIQREPIRETPFLRVYVCVLRNARNQTPEPAANANVPMHIPKTKNTLINIPTKESALQSILRKSHGKREINGVHVLRNKRERKGYPQTDVRRNEKRKEKKKKKGKIISLYS